MPRRTAHLLACAAAATLLRVAFAQSARDPIPADAPYKNPALPFEQRVADLISRMTPEEKTQQLRSAVAANARLGIPPVDWWSEALHGLSRSAGTATVFPQAILMAASWDPPLMQQIGDAIADEARAKYNPAGVRYQGIILWSPTINMARDPRWGRTEETYGEDPYLTGRLAVGFIKGLQGDDPKYLKTVATAKHFAMHSQETNRHDHSFDAPDSVIRDYYLPAFRDAVVDGHVASIMAAFSGINGTPATANKQLLTDILRTEWEFQGAVVTDWGATQRLVDGHRYVPTNTLAAGAALSAGVDVLSDQSDWGAIALTALKEGPLKPEVLDRALARNLLLRFRLGMFDPPELVPFAKTPPSVVGSKEHVALALRGARESIVMLKNDPMPPGSPYTRLLPMDLRRINTIAVLGPYADVLQYGAYSGTPANPSLSIAKALRAAVGERVQVKSVSVADDAEAVRVAGEADLVVFVCGLNSSIEKEGIDRSSLDLPEYQRLLFDRVVKANPATVLLVEGGSPVALQWAKDKVPAMFWIGYPGEQGGNAVAQTLLGQNNPSGRLPMTFYRAKEDLPPLDDYDIRKGRTYMYLTKPAPFVFGHGLSYTTFDYTNVRVAPASTDANGTLAITLDIANTGPLDGDEVVQLYVREKDPKEQRPLKQLKGFQRITLRKGDKKAVTFTLPVSSLGFWDTPAKKFSVDAGAYEILIGASSSDIRAKADITVK